MQVAQYPGLDVLGGGLFAGGCAAAGAGPVVTAGLAAGNVGLPRQVGAVGVAAVLAVDVLAEAGAAEALAAGTTVLPAGDGMVPAAAGGAALAAAPRWAEGRVGWGDGESSFTTPKTPRLPPTSAAAATARRTPRDDFGGCADVTKGADVSPAAGSGV